MRVAVYELLFSEEKIPVGVAINEAVEIAKKYIGAIVSASVHPCAHLLMNADIREELGIVRVGNALCVMITSSEADEYKYLKND